MSEFEVDSVLKNKRSSIVSNIRDSLESYIVDLESTLLRDGDLCSSTENVTKISVTNRSLAIDVDEDVVSEKDEEDFENRIDINIRCDQFFLSYLASCFIEHICDKLHNEYEMVPCDSFQYILDAQICEDGGAFLIDKNYISFDQAINTREDVISTMIQVFLALGFLKDNMDFNHNNLLFNKIQFRDKKYNMYIDVCESDFSCNFTCEIADYSNCIFTVIVAVEPDTDYEMTKNVTFYRNNERNDNLIRLNYIDEEDENSAFSLKDLPYEEYLDIINSNQRFSSSLDFYTFVVSILSNKKIYEMVSEDEDILDFFQSLFPQDDVSIEDLAEVNGEEMIEVYKYLSSKSALYANVSYQVDNFLNSLLEIEDEL